MPTQPTCKVVKREGQRGARIDPKGCKVRTTKDAQGNKRQYNKRGEEKITLKTTSSNGTNQAKPAAQSTPSVLIAPLRVSSLSLLTLQQ